MKKYLFLLLCLASILPIHAMEHKKTGTSYGKEGVLAYGKSRHGDDGGIFLDPYFKPYLEKVSGKKVLDAGCGAGTWAIYAAQHGAKVFGLDIQEGMIEQALESCKNNELMQSCNFVVGDVANLPYEDNFFDLAISIFVSCNLPSPTIKDHLKEMYRTLKKGGLAILTAPIELDRIFSEHLDKVLIKNHIETVLEKINSQTNPSLHVNLLGDLKEINRATFTIKEGQLVIVDKKSITKNSTEIFRKIPGLVVPNFFHTEEEHIELIKETGFQIVDSKKPHFLNEHDWQKYNEINQKTLGKEYIKRSPFIIFVLQK